ncbi:nucleotidyltransferase family protein [Candidatus Micrarchaeota archaeon]|nr:nucleotidyltransferase family protein [Candidatus Micrarchaeota archaeon]
MKVFVIAGGEGTRLRPYTYSTPKPMLPLGGKPLLQYVLENLLRFGMKDIVVTVGYKHEQIVDYFGNGKAFGLAIEYLVEKESRNTAGSIFPYKGKVKDTFVVVMGDHLTNINLSKMLAHHKKSGASATVAVVKDKLQLEYGVANITTTSAGDKISGFTEKPLLEHFYNTAIYIFEPEVFNYILEKEDFAKHVIPKLLKDGKKVVPYLLDGVWFDIGRTSDYERLDEIMKVAKVMKDLD